MPREDWPEVIPIDEATMQFMSPDPNTTSRADFTDFFMRFQHAPDAHALYKHIFLTHQKLIRLLCDHPAMRSNLQQTFSTPANSKNKVYFTWDFVLRTFQVIAAQVDPRDPFSSPMLEDVLSRISQIRTLALDNIGELNRMNANVGYRDDGGVEFTDEIKQLVNDLDKIPDGCAGCGNETKPDGTALLVCARCKTERYCSTDCQKKRWKKHKGTCVAA